LKKQVTYYIVWDILFILFLYLNSHMEQWMKEYLARTMDVASRIWLIYTLPVVTGGFIAWLTCISKRYPSSRKSAFLELILVGIPMLYFTSLPFIYVYINPIIAHSFYIPIPFWMISENIFRIGGILFGYEVIIFIVRIIKGKSFTVSG